MSYNPSCMSLRKDYMDEIVNSPEYQTWESEQAMKVRHLAEITVSEGLSISSLKDYYNWLTDLLEFLTDGTVEH